jgi:RecA-family ATPase
MAERQAVAIPLSEYEEDIAEFLVPKRIPRGAVTLLAGMPDVGKSTWWAQIVGCLTRGEFGDEPIRVLVSSTEDAIKTTIRPRLRAAETVLGNVSVLSMRFNDEDAGEIRFPDDLVEFDRIIAEGDFRLAVIDPIFGHINSSLINVFKDEQVRDKLMTPLKQIAEQRDCAIICVIHLNKRTEANALMRVSGSLGGIVGPARSMLFLHKSPDDETQRILTHEKHNLSEKGRALVFEIESVRLKIRDRDVSLPRMRYVEESEYTGEELLSGKGDSRAVAEAVAFFEAELAGGPQSSKQLRAAARELGISDYAWNTAKRAIGVESHKSDFTGGWELALPLTIKIHTPGDRES